MVIVKLIKTFQFFMLHIYIMKLFGNPIPFNQIQENLLYKIIYKARNETIFKYKRVTVENNSLVLTESDGYKIKIHKDYIKFVCPLNIELNTSYLFRIDGLMMITGRISNITEEGNTSLRANQGYLTRIHVSQITGVLPVNKKSKIMYPLALSGNDVAGAYTALLDTDFDDYINNDEHEDSSEMIIENSSGGKNKTTKNKTKKYKHNK